MQERERERQIQRAFFIINQTIENPCTERKLNDATKNKLFQFFCCLSEIQAKGSCGFYSDKYGQIIYNSPGYIRKSWDQVAEIISKAFNRIISAKTCMRLCAILRELDLLTIKHESFERNEGIPSSKVLQARGKMSGFKVICLKTFSDYEEHEAAIATERLIQTVNTNIAENTPIEQEIEVLETVDNLVQSEKSFCPIALLRNDNTRMQEAMQGVVSNTVGQKLITPAISEDWYVEIADGGVSKPRQVIPRDEVPEEADREFYATWIGEKSGQFWTPWIIWDIDVDEETPVQVALDTTREFVGKLRKVGVPEEGIRVVFSTRRGFHVYLDSRTLALKPSEKLHFQLKNFAKRLLPECDDSLYGMRHVIGIPNSIHRKTGLYYSVLSTEELFSFPIEQMIRHAEHPHDFEAPSEEMKPVQLLCDLFAESNHIEPRKFYPSLAEIKQKVRSGHPAFWGVGKGERDKAMYELAARYQRLGLTIDEARVLVFAANERNRPALSEEEVIKKINSAYRKEGSQIV